MAELSRNLKAILEKVGLGEEFRKWLISQDIIETEDFAMLACDESKVETNIVNKVDPNVPKIKEVGTQVKITKAWKLCRSDVDLADKAKSSSEVSDLEVPLDAITKKSLQTAWQERHNVHLTDGRLLIETLQGRVYREISADPPKFPVLFLEQMRVLSSFERKSHVTLVVKAGEAAKGATVIADCIEGAFEIFIRGRALMTTVAFASIHKYAWFSFSDAEFFSDKLLGFVNQEFKGQRPPLSFFIRAWMYTMQCFSEAVRCNKSSLSDAVRSTATWEHLWTMWVPESSSEIHEGPIMHADSKDLQAEADHFRQMAASMQSERDRAHRLLTQAGGQSERQQQGRRANKARGGKKGGDNGNGNNGNNNDNNGSRGGNPGQSNNGGNWGGGGRKTGNWKGAQLKRRK